MIGLLGGTFDPVHIGHIGIAENVSNEFSPRELRLMPNLVPVHRDSPQATTADRLKMLQLAIANHPLLKIDPCEINRQEVSCSVDSLGLLRAEIGREESIAFILGMDAFNQFMTWKNYAEILKLCHLIVLNRPGSHLSHDPELHSLLKTHQVLDPQQLKTKAAGYIYLHEIEIIDISASAIRNHQLSTGISAVDEYIKSHQLYTNQGTT